MIKQLLIFAFFLAITQTETLLAKDTEYNFHCCGEFMQPKSNCGVNVKRSSDGGFIQLIVINKATKKKSRTIDDVNQYAWINSREVIYSVSPIYGVPGIYKINCDAKKIVPKVIVAPENFDSAYPKGADYFELYKVDNNQASYFYAKDVDAIDFKTFRTPQNLKSVQISQ